MNYEEMKAFREEVVVPKEKAIFDALKIPEGKCYIDKVEILFPDCRNCGVDSRYQLSGLMYRNGKAERVCIEEYDVSASEFFQTYKDCVFVTEGKLVIENELEEIKVETIILNFDKCSPLFVALSGFCFNEYHMESDPIPFIKMQRMIQPESCDSEDTF